MGRKLIRVTKADIAKGEPAHGLACPVALALRRELPDRPIGITLEGGVEISFRWSCFSRSAKRFIAAFDKGGAVRPFSFYLDLPASEQSTGS